MGKKSRFIWQEKPMPQTEDVQRFKEETGCSTAFATICLQRGINTKAELETFVAPTLESLHDPFLMHDMEKGVSRIREAVENNERILIYGDYDADGMTSATILAETLESMGADIKVYLPNRFVDGYGPNKDVFMYMIHEADIQLIVTCDNGVAGHEAIAYAMQQGVDVIVTDHHELPDTLPDAYAIIHPRHPEGNYPFGDLSGAGVAFKVATALLDEVPMESLDIVAIGTIADLVSVTDENRVLVLFGLMMLQQTQRIGLIKLLESIGVSLDQVSAETIGFGIGPRLNALGRLDDANPAVDLLMTFDEEEAMQLVALLENKNNERKQIVDEIVSDVVNGLGDTIPNVIVMANKKWHAGVLGIVASRIVEQTGKPTILLQSNPETQTAKGSGRSVESVNLFELLNAHKELLVQFGGHHMAAGMTVALDKIEALAQALQDAVPANVQKEVVYDLALPVQDCTVQLIHELKKLEPFGTDNEKPVICVQDAVLSQMKTIGTQNQHLKGLADALDVIQFQAEDTIPYLKDGVHASFIGQLKLNEWNGLEKAQLQILDARVDGVQLFDIRSSTVKKSACEIENAVYLFSDEKHYTYFSQHIPSSSYALYYKDVIAETVDNVVLFDCPSTLEELEQALAHIRCENIYVHAFSRQQAYLMGVPTREQFGLVYKIIHSQKQINLREQFEQLRVQTTLKKDVLILILQVFSDAKFVTITDGVVTINDTAQRHVLEDTPTMKQHLQKIEVEKLLVYTDFATVSDVLKKYINEDGKS